MKFQKLDEYISSYLSGIETEFQEEKYTEMGIEKKVLKICQSRDRIENIPMKKKVEFVD